MIEPSYCFGGQCFNAQKCTYVQKCYSVHIVIILFWLFTLELQTRRSERKRKNTANPQFWYGNLEAEVRNGFIFRISFSIRFQCKWKFVLRFHYEILQNFGMTLTTQCVILFGLVIFCLVSIWNNSEVLAYFL